MKKYDYLKIIISFILILLLGMSVGYYLIPYQENSLNSLTDNINITITIGISLIALLYAMITYYSIDAVDKKNRMDNNLLEAENYTVAYHKILTNLNCKEQSEFNRKIYKEVVEDNHVKTCMQFAEWVQNIIDHIVLFAYYQWDEDNKNKFIHKLKSKYKNYNNIGSRIKILLEENINLIEQVLNYQNRKNIDTYSSFEDIRGRMLPNPISKIAYFDYLGLDYRRQAAEMMGQKLDMEFSFTEDCLKKWEENKENIVNNQNLKCFFLIQTAKNNFELASKVAQEDILWMGYIKYNLVRTEIMLFLFSEEQQRKDMIEHIHKDMDSCIEARERVCFMFSQEGYLSKKFENEKNAAIDLKYIFQKVFKDYMP